MDCNTTFFRGDKSVTVSNAFIDGKAKYVVNETKQAYDNVKEAFAMAREYLKQQTKP